MTDKKRLQQILINLQSNAIKFIKNEGTIKIKAVFVPKESQNTYKEILENYPIKS